MEIVDIAQAVQHVGVEQVLIRAAVIVHQQDLGIADGEAELDGGLLTAAPRC